MFCQFSDIILAISLHTVHVFTKLDHYLLWDKMGKNDKILASTLKQVSKSVVLNRGVGAAKRCQGCHQILNLLSFINVLLHKVPHFVTFNQVRVPPFFQAL
jgi:hypothetical protein